jgi:hypothetical protein
VCCRIVDAVDRAREVDGGGVLDPVDVEGLGADLGSQRVDEDLTDAADARRLTGAAGEHHLDVGAARSGCADGRLGGGGGNGRAHQRPRRKHRHPEDLSGVT